MSLRHQRPSDSLDLLLDTMCNTFGGIIMLAVLVTLLSSRERQERPETPSDTEEMLQRRLNLAQANLQKALQLQTTLQTKVNDPRWKSQLPLLATRQQLQDEVKVLRDLASRKAKDLSVTANDDPSARMKQLVSELTMAQARKVEAQNSVDAAKENVKRLTVRLADLGKQTTARVNESQRQLRLPKEHKTDKKSRYVIAKYGKIYICRDSDSSQNKADMKWISRSGGDDEAQPKQEKGIDPMANPAALTSYFAGQSAESVYIAFVVYGDSFPAFLHAKRIAINRGLSYGWEPFQESRVVIFSKEGHDPAPQ
ncbi:MAG: hypothetical protein NTV12_02535 [Verrucomicrobia bacterium]|nr:hypothetical protein [Verrucomicrobiota bacterium]